jgi:signal transduction histidine kinase
MTRPCHIWLVFAVCTVLLLGVMAWVSFTTLRLDRLQVQAAQAAEVEERARLALWRMDSWMGALILEESARPFSDYEAFAAAPRAYTKSQAPVKQGEILVPSPLLDFASSNILLHFQYHADGQLSSPQVPVGEWRSFAVNRGVSAARIEEARGRLAEMDRILREPAVASTLLAAGGGVPAAAGSAGPADNAGLMVLQTERPFEWSQTQPPSSVGNTPWSAQPEAGQQAEVAVVDPASQAATPPDVQQFRNNMEFNSRANTFQQAQQRLTINNYKQMLEEGGAAVSSAPESVSGLGAFRAVWLGEALVLARRVDLGSDVVVQGAWLDWPRLQSALCDSVADLFPEVRLEPASPIGPGADDRVLASLPVRLVIPGEARWGRGSIPWTPLRLSLLLAWVCVLGAGLAVAFLIRGIVALSERRAAFVSAVTHELRTPLTTFKMYSEMLAGEMVPDESKRRHYLRTLCSEADRLSHLVENVLAYARLERGSAQRREERIALRDLLDRVKPRLLERATLAGMVLQEDVDERAGQTVVRVDVAAVEQILFNLVDNACKYAVDTDGEKIIHLEVLPEAGGRAMLRVRDHGQGISPEAARRLFKPFSKTASQAAHTAPGVGLGLALCRRLSRVMGGNLRWDSRVTDGAAFLLVLPMASERRQSLQD